MPLQRQGRHLQPEPRPDRLDTWTWGDEFGALAGLSFIGNKYHEERAFNIEFVDQSGAGGTFGAGNPPPANPLLAPFVMGYIPIGGDRDRAAGNFALQWRPDPRDASSTPRASSRASTTSSSSTSSSACRCWATAREGDPEPGHEHPAHAAEQQRLHHHLHPGERQHLPDAAVRPRRQPAARPAQAVDRPVLHQVPVRADQPHPRPRDRGAARSPSAPTPAARPSSTTAGRLRHHHGRGLRTGQLVRQPPRRQRRRRRLARAMPNGPTRSSAHVDKLAVRPALVRPQRRLDRRHPRRHRRPARRYPAGLGVPRPRLRLGADGLGRPDYIMTQLVHPLRRLPPQQHRHHPPGLHGHDRAEAPRSRHVLRHVGEDLRGLRTGRA